MAQYIQLLGTDTPNSYGGCCYCGPVNHPALSVDGGGGASKHSTSGGALYEGEHVSSPLSRATEQAWREARARVRDVAAAVHTSPDPIVSEADAAMNNTSSSPFAPLGTEGCLLFNCPEGTQRFSSEANLKLTKIRGFFFTRWARHVADDTTSDTTTSTPLTTPSSSLPSPAEEEVADARGEGAGSAVMGLPGLLFTVNDAGVRHATFFGPSSALRAVRPIAAAVAPVSEAACTDSGEGARVGGTSPCSAEATAACAAAGLRADAARMRLTGVCGDLDLPSIACGGHCSGTAHPSVGDTAATDEPVRTCFSSGLERFLFVLRGAYFHYRPMVFRQLVSVDLAGARSPACTRALQAIARRSVDALADGSWAPAPQDEAYPLLLHADANTRGKDTPTAAPAAAFRLMAVLPLNAQSALVAFRVSTDNAEGLEGGAVGALLPDSSADVFGYALVHAPQPAFDAAEARRLGVRPGPKYALLKQGLPVEADEEAGSMGEGRGRKGRPPAVRVAVERAVGHTVAGGSGVADVPSSKLARTEGGRVAGGEPGVPHAGELPSAPASASSPRLVYPHEVVRPTTSSRQLFITLVLDGNDPTDVRDAVEALLLGGPHEEPGGALTRALRLHCPEMIVHGHPATPRTVLLHQVVHVQPESYFVTHGFTDPDAYLARVFGRVVASGQLRASVTTLPLGRTAGTHVECASAGEVEPTLHFFTSQWQRSFSAFPTALAHRHHLSAIAPECFPGCHRSPASPPRREREVGVVAEEPCESTRERVDSPDAPGAPAPLWPYSLKFKCVVDTSGAPAQRGPREAGAGGGAASARAAEATPSTASLAPTVPHVLPARVLSEGVSAGYIRYPTPESAVAMLSAPFREHLARVRARVAGGLSTIAPPLSSPRASPTAVVDEGCAAFGYKDGGGALAFTGTGSAVPSKYRNVSGTLLEVHAPPVCFDRVGRAGLHRGVFVLDSGEGSVGQLSGLLPRGPRVEGGQGVLGDAMEEVPGLSAELVEYLLDMELVFLSHGHADHHLGLLTLLTCRHRCLCARRARYAQGCEETRTTASRPSPPPPRRELTRPLLIVLPAEVFRFLHYTWFTATPYADWIYKECTFDILPALSFPGRSVRACAETTPRGKADDALENEEGVVEANGVPISWLSAAEVNPSPVSLGFPRLRAQCARWNACMRAVYGGELPSTSPTAADPLPYLWWDADVFTVDHPANAHGLLLRFPYFAPSPSGSAGVVVPVPLSRVFLFSGDTRPSEELVARCHRFCGVRAGGVVEEEGAVSRPPSTAVPRRDGLFLCLHEATFGPGFEAEAVKKKHSTLPEALDIGARTFSEFVVLNHFSQRYPKLPGLMEEHLGGCAVDLHCRPGSRRAAQARLCAGGAGVESTPSTATLSGVADAAMEEDHAGDEAGGSAGPNMCFAFDFMRLPFTQVESGAVARLLPTFVRLLEEYESWGVGTTQRLRE